jgi:hypothetical protein
MYHMGFMNKWIDLYDKKREEVLESRRQFKRSIPTNTPLPSDLLGEWGKYCTLCNVPTLGHHHRAETYDDQSIQMDVITSTRVFERNYGVQLEFIIIFHHYEPFRTGWLWFRSILTISMILTILSYKLIKITEEVILGTLLGGTSQCNSSLESGGETL